MKKQFRFIRLTGFLMLLALSVVLEQGGQDGNNPPGRGRYTSMDLSGAEGN